MRLRPITYGWYLHRVYSLFSYVCTWTRSDHREVVRLMGLPYLREEIFLLYATIGVPIQLMSLNRSRLNRFNKRF